MQKNASRIEGRKFMQSKAQAKVHGVMDPRFDQASLENWKESDKTVAKGRSHGFAAQQLFLDGKLLQPEGYN
jgi:hypothetical protein